MKCTSCLAGDGQSINIIWNEVKGSEEESSAVYCDKCKMHIKLEFCSYHKVWYEQLCEECEKIELPLHLYSGRKVR